MLLALGFIGPEQKILNDFGVSIDDIGNIDSAYGKFTTNVTESSAGDARRGQSLVVWAMNEGEAQLLQLIDIYKGQADFRHQ